MPSKVNHTIQQLNKEIKSYVSKVESESDYVFRDRAITYNNFFTDKMLINYSIQEGIPYKIFKLIQALSPFSEADWARFLDISTKSLARYKQAMKKFKPSHSEKIISLAEVLNTGLEVFGNMEKFKLWLDTPNFSLGKAKPFDLLDNSYGKEMVIGELTRINYGILA